MKIAIGIGLALFLIVVWEIGTKPPVGRFQVIQSVGLQREVILLDTVTGDAYLRCLLSEGVHGWCFLPANRKQLVKGK